VLSAGEVPIQSPIEVADVEKDDSGSREIETESLLGGSHFLEGGDWAG
jgi:hypothetical protein